MNLIISKYKLIMQMLSSVPMSIDLFDLKPSLSGLLVFFIVITVRKRSLGKVMFSQTSVSHSVQGGGGGGSGGGGRYIICIIG